MSIGAKHISSHCLDIVSLSVLKASVALSYPYLEVTALSGVQSRFFFPLPFSLSVASVRCMLSVNKGSEQFRFFPIRELRALQGQTFYAYSEEAELGKA